MNKIAIIGSGGAGKSTLARLLGDILFIPVYHLDALNWKPGWVPTPEHEWDEINARLVSHESWIIDGNYGRTIDIRLQEADTIIYLDFPTYLNVFRDIKRRIQYHGKTRPDMGEGCKEQIDWQFVRWILNYRREKRPDIMNKLNRLKDEKNIHIVASPKQLRKLVKQIESSSHAIRNHAGRE